MDSHDMKPSNVENLAPQTIKQIYRELRELTENPMEGIRVICNEDDITSVQADIEGPPGTPYQSGLFRVKLVLGKSFPQTPPKGFFVTKIFHPNVGKDGEICVNTLKKDWKRELGIKHILLTIKCLLIVPNPESALNEEAGMLLLEQYEDYCRRAKMFTEIHAPKVAEQNKTEKKQQSNKNSDPLDLLKECLFDDDDDDMVQSGETFDQKSRNTTTTSSSTNATTNANNNNKPHASASSKNRGLKRVLRLRH